MKKYLLLFLLPLISVSAYADKLKIKVDEKSENIAGGSHNCLVVTIYDAKSDDIEKEWRSKMKGYDAKVSGKDEIFADNALIKDISDNTVDVYARTEKGSNDNETTFIVGFQMGEDWLNSGKYSVQYKAAEKIVEDFARQMSKDAIADKLKDEQKKLSALQDAQADLEKKNKKLNDDIADYNDKIKKAQDDIKTNESDQQKQKDAIAAQQKIVDDMTARQNSVE